MPNALRSRPTPRPTPPAAGYARARWLALVALAVALSAAACQRERLYGERAPVGKAYHNFTARFNGHFNAEELVGQAETELAASAKTDYTEILPVYPAYASDNPAAAAPLLDKAMQKLSLVVNIHRPSDYDDNSYLLFGKAQLLKQDYESAEHTFEYSVKEFAPDNEAARLRRIEKDRIADEKEREKADRLAGAPARNKPAARTTSPQRRTTSRPSSRTKTRSSRGSSAKSSSKSKAKSSPTKRSTPTRGSGSSASKDAPASKKLPKKGKPKTRAEMAKEQREAKLAALKEAAKEQDRAERDAEKAAEKAAEAEVEKATAIEAGELPDATAALDDGAGLAAPTTDEKRPKHGPFIHEESRQDFDYWLARTYVARERYVDAERLLGALARSGATFKHIRRQLPGAYADMNLRRGQLAEAVPFLEDAIALTKGKHERARYAFILGQVHQRLGASAPAIASFRQVVKLKPDFDMAFNAQVNLLTTEYRVGSATAASTLKELRRMSKETKYTDQRDQIFYEMAEIALANGDRDEGLGYMRESLAANTGNNVQAARGYLRLANLYFEDEGYVLANAYFDSTLQVLPADDARVAQVTAYRDNLAPVAANLTTIGLQDSLLTIARLSPEEQTRFATKLDKDRREADLAAAIAQSRRDATQQSAGVGRSPVGPAALQAGARRPAVGGGAVAGGAQPVVSYFAYDAKAARRGSREFQRKWGDRPLIDNWRTISDREAVVAVDAVDSLRQTRSDPVAADLETILRDVPNDSASQARANSLIADALMGLGRQYRDKLQNPRRAAEALEELLRRYPQTDFAPEALYLLGVAYDELGLRADADRARARLKQEFAQSDYARSLTDPAFFDEARGAERKLISYYDETYARFQAGDAAGARERLAAAGGQFGNDHALSSRFALLGAMIAGKLDGREAYVDALKAVAVTYPASEESTKARDILRLLGERSAATTALDKAAATGTDPEAPASNFEYSVEQPHYFVAVLPKGTDLAAARAKVSDYNGQYHRLDKLAVGNVFMVREGEQTPVIVIRRFDNAAAAMSFYAGASGKASEFMGDVAFESAVISQNNYREVLRNKSLGEYLDFFAERYQ